MGPLDDTLTVVPALQVRAVSGDQLELRGGSLSTATGEQVPCIPTEAIAGEVTASDALTPELHVAADRAWVGLSTPDTVLPLDHFRLVGAPAADGPGLEAVQISAQMDVREPAIPLDGTGPEDPDRVCEDLGSFAGVSCDACADGEPYCVALRIDDATASAVDLDLAEVAPCR